MKLVLLQDLVQQNNCESLKEILSMQIEKYSYLSKRCSQLTIYALVVAVIFCLSLSNKTIEFEIEGFKFQNFQLFQAFTPVIFSYLLFEYHLTTVQRENLLRNIKFLIAEVYKIPSLENKSDLHTIQSSNILSEIAPFSIISTYFSTIIEAKKLNATHIITIPFTIILILLIPVSPITFLLFSMFKVVKQLTVPLYIIIFSFTISAGFLSFVIIDWLKRFVYYFKESSKER